MEQQKITLDEDVTVLSIPFQKTWGWHTTEDASSDYNSKCEVPQFSS